MARPFVVAVSGMVGSGKSTVLKRILDLLQREGVPSAAWQFQRLPCFTFRFSSRAGGERTSAPTVDRTVPTQQRGRGYRRKELTARVTAGYLLRIAAFRLYRRWPRRETWAVSNRYFYDNLAHYEITSRRAMFFRRILAASIPRPDVAILLTAGQATLAARRPNYADEYLVAVGEGYERLRGIFPGLLEFRTDEGEDSLRRIEDLIRQRLHAARGPVANPTRTAPRTRG